MVQFRDRQNFLPFEKLDVWRFLWCFLCDHVDDRNFLPGFAPFAFDSPTRFGRRTRVRHSDGFPASAASGWRTSRRFRLDCWRRQWPTSWSPVNISVNIQRHLSICFDFRKSGRKILEREFELWHHMLDFFQISWLQLSFCFLGFKIFWLKLSSSKMFKMAPCQLSSKSCSQKFLTLVCNEKRFVCIPVQLVILQSHTVCFIPSTLGLFRFFSLVPFYRACDSNRGRCVFSG